MAYGTLLFIFLYFCHAQVFVPFSYWTDKSISFPALSNLDGPQYVTVSQTITVTNKSANLDCSSTYFSATSSNTSVLSLANITFSGTFPNCIVSYLTNVNSGVSNITITYTNQWNMSYSSSFVFTAYQKPVMAFSFRKVVKDYVGSAIRVRRVSDNAESDIGFDGSGNLDLTTYNSFKGASTLRLKIWYDQSGNGYNASQTTTSLQPNITTNGFNGAPQVEFSNTYWLQTTQAQNVLSSLRDVTIFYATKAISESRTIFGLRLASNVRVGSHINWSDNNLYWDSPGACCSNSRISFNNSANVNTPQVYALGRDNGYQYIKVNGTDAATRTNASGTLSSGTANWYLGATNDNGSVNEIVSSPLAEYIQYKAGLTDSQVTAIAVEQKNYYGL